jgi:FkbM family methyltransferase
LKEVNGWWFPDGEAHLTRFVVECGSYQSRHRETALSFVRNFGVAVDIGAHVGLWARDLSEKFSTVHCFEPVDAHRECFARNVPAGNVTLHACALGEAEGTVKMAVDPENTGGTHIEPGAEGDVPLRTLDSFGLDGVDFIKIDCESYEVNVLKGSVETLKRCKPVVCIEQKPHSWFGHGQYDGAAFLLGVGARYLGNHGDDLCFGW